MKRCPECRRDYYDDSLLYCLDDGAALLEGPASGNESATAILHKTEPPSEAATRAQLHTTDFSGFEGHAVARRGFPIKTAIIAGAVIVVAFIGYFGFFARSASGQIDSIAVMPFVNASANPDVEYISDGITESLINSLSQLSKLSVKARSSVFRYKGKDVEPQQIAADLHVKAVLNGRVVQRGDSLTISLDLVDGATGNQIWGEQFARKMGDLATLQTEIAREVSQKLRLKLTGAEQQRVVKNQTQNTEAYQLYLQGRYNWNKRTRPTTERAIEYFRQAIEKDPDYAMAYVGLAESYVISSGPDSDRMPKIKSAALKAIELDPGMGEPHAALGIYFDTYERDHVSGENEYKKAMELSPNYSTAYHWWAETLVSWGRIDEGLTAYRKALEIDPFSLAIGTDYGIALFYARQYDQSVDYLKKLIEMDPTYLRTYEYLARVYQTSGKFEDALNAYEKHMTLEGKDPAAVAQGKRTILDALKTSGAKGYWSKILEYTLESLKKGEDVDIGELARNYAQLGDREQAIKWLDKAVSYRITDIAIMLKVSPEWDNVRDDPRFAEIVKKVGIP